MADDASAGAAPKSAAPFATTFTPTLFTPSPTSGAAGFGGGRRTTRPGRRFAPTKAKAEAKAKATTGTLPGASVAPGPTLNTLGSRMDYVNEHDEDGNIVAVPVRDREGRKSFALTARRLVKVPHQVFQHLDVHALMLEANPGIRLPPQLFNLSALAVLLLQRCDLDDEALAPGLARLPALTDLRLHDNKLTRLPPGLDALTNLTHLDVARNDITRLEPSLAACAALTYLNIDENKLVELDPLVLAPLTALTTLSMTSVRARKVPAGLAAPGSEPDGAASASSRHVHAAFVRPAVLSFAGCSSCSARPRPPETLFRCWLCSPAAALCGACLEAAAVAVAPDLEPPPLPPPRSAYHPCGVLDAALALEAASTESLAPVALPYTVTRLHALEMLHAGNNTFETLPPRLDALTALTALDVRKSKFGTLPPELGALTGLTVLRVSNCELVAVPDVFGNLAQLTALDLHHNRLSALPPSLGRLERLSALDVSHNNLSSIPPMPACPLESLDISHNAFSRLPDSFVVRQLVAAHNRITEFPAALWAEGEANITILDLSYNRITSAAAGKPVRGVVSSRTVASRTLILDGNLLTEIPVGIEASLFSLSHNSFTPLMAECLSRFIISRYQSHEPGKAVTLDAEYYPAAAALRAAVLFETIELVLHTLAVDPDAADRSPDAVALADFVWSSEREMDTFMWLMWHLPPELRNEVARFAADAPAVAPPETTVTARAHVAQVVATANESALTWLAAHMLPAASLPLRLTTLLIDMRAAMVKVAAAVLKHMAPWLHLTLQHRTRLLNVCIEARDLDCRPVFEAMAVAASDASEVEARLGALVDAVSAVPPLVHAPLLHVVTGTPPGGAEEGLDALRRFRPSSMSACAEFVVMLSIAARTARYVESLEHDAARFT